MRLSVEDMAARGVMPAGWTPVSWAARLAYLAGRCAADHPDLAATYRQWAETIEAREAQRIEDERRTAEMMDGIRQAGTKAQRHGECGRRARTGRPTGRSAATS